MLDLDKHKNLSTEELIALKAAAAVATPYPVALGQFKPQCWCVTNTNPAVDTVPPENTIFILGDNWYNYLVDINGNVTGHEMYVCVYDEPANYLWDNSDGTPFNY